jgi:hypothetical protein
MPKSKRPALAYAEERFDRANPAGTEGAIDPSERLDPFRVVTLQVMGEEERARTDSTESSPPDHQVLR